MEHSLLSELKKVHKAVMQMMTPLQDLRRLPVKS
jgi:hypothetical protein